MLQKKNIYIHLFILIFVPSTFLFFLFSLLPSIRLPGFFFTEFLFFRRWNSATSVESPRAHLSAYLCDYLLFNTHTHTHTEVSIFCGIFFFLFFLFRSIDTNQCVVGLGSAPLNAQLFLSLSLSLYFALHFIIALDFYRGFYRVFLFVFFLPSFPSRQQSIFIPETAATLAAADWSLAAKERKKKSAPKKKYVKDRPRECFFFVLFLLI